MSLIREMLEDWVGRAILLLLLLVLATIPYLVYLVNEEAKEWAAFSVAHECKVVARMSGSISTGTGFGVLSNGKAGMVVATSTTPGKTGYACNDGITYWR